MKKYWIITVMLACSAALLAQVPQSFKYQAVARDGSGEVIADQEMSFEIAILRGNPEGDLVFAEQHTKTTNQFGLVTLQIGNGNILAGDFSEIEWGSDEYFLMVEIDGVYMGNTQLLSVPYALHALTVAEDKTEDADSDSLNEIQTLSLIDDSLSLSRGGGSIKLPVPSSGGDNWGSQTVVSNVTLSGNGTTAAPLQIADNGVSVAKLPEGATAETYLRGDGIWVKPEAGIEVETDPTWNGDAIEASDIGRVGRVGIGITNPAALLHVRGNDTLQGNVLFSGTYKSLNQGDPAISGPGTRMIWYPDKAAFRAGNVEDTQWDKSSIGDFSVAMGQNTTALGTACVALGYNTFAVGQSSMAMGASSEASGWSSVALGGGTKAISVNSLAIGSFNVGWGDGLEWISTDPIFEIGIGQSEFARANAMTVLKNGNIGIGTITPSEKLDIDGQIRIRSGGPGMGKVLTSDATGVATWEMPGFNIPWSDTTSAGSYGINIEHLATTGTNYGGYFKSASTSGVGVYGIASANNGNAWGVHGESNSISGTGVFGHSLAGSGESFGVVGISESTEGAGVFGANNLSKGTKICGVRGSVLSSTGYSGYFTGGRFYVDGNAGIGTDSPLALLHTKGTENGQGNVLFEGSYKSSNQGDPPASGSGTRMMWYPDKSAFRVGYVSKDLWDKANIGSHSIGLGCNSYASGIGSTSIGYQNSAGGFTSVAMGRENSASGDHSIAMGYITLASGSLSTAMGYKTIASGVKSVAMGSCTNAPSAYETVIGVYNEPYTPNSTTEWNPDDRLFVVGNGQDAKPSAGGTNAMTILKNGKVGIGTSVPGRLLHVYGDVNPRILIQAPADQAPELNLQRGSTVHAIYINNNNDLVFYQNGDRVTFTENGDVGIGTTNPNHKLDLVGEFNIQSLNPAHKAILVNSKEALWYGGNFFSWGYGGNYNYFARSLTIGTNADPGSYLLVVNGNAAKVGGGSWATWSDVRLKDIHGDYQKGLKEISELHTVTYSYKENNDLALPDDEEYAGLVAQEVQEIFPEAVSEGNDGYLKLDMSPVTIALINAIKDLKRENDELRQRIESLENKSQLK